MKYLAASAHTVSFIQLLGLLGTIYGLINYEIHSQEILIILAGYFLYSGLGVSLTYHRYFTHKSFEFKYQWIKKICMTFALLAGRGSPIGWVYVHRLHHGFSDTANDPHDPKRYGWKVFFPHMLHYGETINKKIIKDLFTREHVDINKFYLLFIIVWATILLLINPYLLVFFYLIPVFLSGLALDLFVFLSHAYGYRNHNTRDNSKNNWFISLILWGEGWHNNHHNSPNNYTTQEKWYEVDLLGYIIRLIRT
jgi:stearoyl-CoA desaturase (delta-9 desaturase)